MLRFVLLKIGVAMVPILPERSGSVKPFRLQSYPAADLVSPLCMVRMCFSPCRRLSALRVTLNYERAFNLSADSLRCFAAMDEYSHILLERVKRFLHVQSDANAGTT